MYNRHTGRFILDPRMAILWQQQQQGTLYEVRSAGNTRRLYTDGVFHSQYNPNQPVAGGAWDLLMLPIFFTEPGRIRRILVLGVGGGAVLHLLRRFTHPDEVVGVELNPVHIEVAQRFFDVNRKVAKLHQADAVEWLKNYHGEPFDYIVDDLFGEDHGEPVRAVEANADWFRLLQQHLSPSGILVMNTISNRQVRNSGYFTDADVRHGFRSAFRFGLPLYENIIVAFCRELVDIKTFRRHLHQQPELNTWQVKDRLNFTLSQLRT